MYEIEIEFHDENKLNTKHTCFSSYELANGFLVIYYKHTDSTVGYALNTMAKFEIDNMKEI